MTTKNPIVIPYWVANAFKRQRLPLAGILNYQVASEILSLEDRATLLNLQQFRPLDYVKGYYSTHLLSSWTTSAQGDSRIELDSTVVPLSHSKPLEDRNVLRLSQNYVASQNSLNDTIGLDHITDQEVFELNDFARDSYALILQPGILEALGTYETKMKLVKAMLKISYGYFDTHKVSTENVFSAYVVLLNDKVWGRAVA